MAAPFGNNGVPRARFRSGWNRRLVVLLCALGANVFAQSSSTLAKPADEFLVRGMIEGSSVEEVYICHGNYMKSQYKGKSEDEIVKAIKDQWQYNVVKSTDEIPFSVGDKDAVLFRFVEDGCSNAIGVLDQADGMMPFIVKNVGYQGGKHGGGLSLASNLATDTKQWVKLLTDDKDKVQEPLVTEFWLVSWGDITNRWDGYIKDGDKVKVLDEIKELEDTGRFDEYKDGGDAWKTKVAAYYKDKKLGPTVKVTNDSDQKLECRIVGPDENPVVIDAKTSKILTIPGVECFGSKDVKVETWFQGCECCGTSPDSRKIYGVEHDVELKPNFGKLPTTKFAAIEVEVNGIPGDVSPKFDGPADQKFNRVGDTNRWCASDVPAHGNDILVTIAAEGFNSQTITVGKAELHRGMTVKKTVKLEKGKPKLFSKGKIPDVAGNADDFFVTIAPEVERAFFLEGRDQYSHNDLMATGIPPTAFVDASDMIPVKVTPDTRAKYLAEGIKVANGRLELAKDVQGDWYLKFAEGKQLEPGEYIEVGTCHAVEIDDLEKRWKEKDVKTVKEEMREMAGDDKSTREKIDDLANRSFPDLLAAIVFENKTGKNIRVKCGDDWSKELPAGKKARYTGTYKTYTAYEDGYAVNEYESQAIAPNRTVFEDDKTVSVFLAKLKPKPYVELSFDPPDAAGKVGKINGALIKQEMRDGNKIKYEIDGHQMKVTLDIEFSDTYDRKEDVVYLRSGNGYDYGSYASETVVVEHKEQPPAPPPPPAKCAKCGTRLVDGNCPECAPTEEDAPTDEEKEYIYSLLVDWEKANNKNDRKTRGNRKESLWEDSWLNGKTDEQIRNAGFTNEGLDLIFKSRD